jgi:peptide/nickel transport system permease protein
MKIPLTLKKLFRRRIVLAAGICLLIVVIVALLANVVSGYDPNDTAVRERLSAPTAKHLLGTDELGRDLFARIAFGARYSLTIAALTAIGFNVVFALVLVYTPRVARVVRASTLVVRELLFVEAARAVGVSTGRILLRHILPNLMSPILVQASFIFAYAILAEAALSFLGVGVPPEIPTWGTMVAGSQQYAHEALWIVLFPGLAIILTALSLQLLGDGVRDLLDPRLKKSM